MESKTRLERRYKYGTRRQFSCTKIVGWLFYLVNGEKRQNYFSYVQILEKKSISIFLKATYAKNICFEKNKTKLSGRESRTTLLCHDGKLFSHDCWLLPLAIVKKYTLKKKTQTPNPKPENISKNMTWIIA